MGNIYGDSSVGRELTEKEQQLQDEFNEALPSGINFRMLPHREIGHGKMLVEYKEKSFTMPIAVYNALRNSTNGNIGLVFKVEKSELYGGGYDYGLRRINANQIRDLDVLCEVIQNDRWNDKCDSFLIIDENGNSVYQSGQCNMNINSVDENGYVFIDGSSFVVHSIIDSEYGYNATSFDGDGFVSGNTVEEVNQKYPLKFLKDSRFYDGSFHTNPEKHY